MSFRPILVPVMMWSLVAAPALCRAGALRQCCAHDAVPLASDDRHPCGDGDCRCSSDGSEDERDPQECGSCAEVCKGSVKPPDESDHAVPPPGTALVIHEWAPAANAGFESTPAANGPRRDKPNLPFALSDVPLLI